MRPMPVFACLGFLLSSVAAQVARPAPAAGNDRSPPARHSEPAEAHAAGDLEAALAALERGDVDAALAALADEGHHLAEQGPAARVVLYAAYARACAARGGFRSAAAWVSSGVDAAMAACGDDAPCLARGVQSLAESAPAPEQAFALRSAAAWLRSAGTDPRAAAEGRAALLAARAVREDPAAPTIDDPIRLGTGRHRYTWVKAWGRLPERMSYGNTHGCIAIDAGGRIYVNTDTENAIIVFERDGTFVRAFGKDLAGGLHGMIIVKDGDREVLVLAHHGRGQALKMTLDGETLLTIDWPEASGLYQDRGQFHPTSVAVAPDGRLFVADGYGLSYVHRYDAAGKYLGSFGGKGTEPGKMQTPHGLWIDTRGKEPALVVSDRENHRLQRFDFEGRLLGVVAADLRRPCNLSAHGGDIAVADLAGRVTILDSDDRLVTHLGDQPDPAKRAQNGIPRDQWTDGEFISPHSCCFDADGNLYVMDWLALGRISKLERSR